MSDGLKRAREYLRMIDELQDDLDRYQQEALNLCFVSVAIITAITVLAYHLGDSTVLILFYLGWCLYVVAWSVIFRSRFYDEKARN